jgi:putative transposase
VLFLRKQVAFYREHQVRPRKLSEAGRFSLVLWSQLFNWKVALMIVKPENPHRLASPGVQAVLAVEVAVGTTADSGSSSPADGVHGAGEPGLGRGAHRSRTFGEARDLGFAANGAGVLAERDPRGGRRTSSQHWRTFVRNHAKVIVASDFWWRSRPDSACCMCSL